MNEISLAAPEIAASRQQGTPADEGKLWETLRLDAAEAKPASISHQGAGFNAEGFGRVARGDRAGGVRKRLHDDDGLAAQGRIACGEADHHQPTAPSAHAEPMRGTAHRP